MDAIAQSQFFFLISSMGFIILWILSAILLFYLIRAADSFNRIIERMEKDIDKIGDTTKEMVKDMRDSVIFKFLFKKKRNKSK